MTENLSVNFIHNIETKLQECRKLPGLVVEEDTCLDIMNIGSGTFAPLNGFMTSKDYHNVVEEMHLENGYPWTIPITLDISRDEYKKIRKKKKVCLCSGNSKGLATLNIEDIFEVDFDNDIRKIYGVDDCRHPGVCKERQRNRYRIGGRLEVLPGNYNEKEYLDYLPDTTCRIFKEKGWKTVAGFQTRNPIHRAHEYLQRTAMEFVDGLFIHPLIGWKKRDEFTPMAIIETYKKMIDSFYPENRVFLGTLRTAMRYAGPREAVFHAIIRRNYGCTHFIVGRDHAGVGGYYGKYDAHDLLKKMNNIGIEIIMLHGPYFCRTCGQIVTDKTCSHGERHALEVSGTCIREMISQGKYPPEEFMRKEIAEILIRLHKEHKAFYRGG